MMKIPTIEEMLKAGMHFGHHTARWYPKMKPFIFTARKGVHIIDLMKTQKMLGEALEYLKKSASEGKTILLVGTKIQVKKTLKKVAEEAGVSYVAEHWLGGFLTNFSVIRNLIRKYKDLIEKRATGKLDKYTKKERLDFDREIAKLETNVGGLASLTNVPDVIFIWDIKHEKTALTEAIKKNIPVVAVCDTNSNPTGVKYIVPSNDDATKAVKLIMELIKEAILEGKELGIRN
ncbi:30S ribosomal protein S2 [Patescibacteria group bacterium]|nr:30S ribosomal protein S2 [Patescibacteria group bacterium]MBU0879491.1 30S ribosomal protein S2 [Patescibacteria group bacterium]MBU0880119.1 30S ribosomal protein S2 [Patescibacteria group bacterium]MBU1991808.1 30S ribosomal protein S2 [Patescibacteria group bacterium]